MTARQTTTETPRFIDAERPTWAPPDWVGGVNYALVDSKTGRRVTGRWSAAARRYILPGEMVHICDEWGYWRDRPPVMLIGEDASRSNWLVYYADDTGDHAADLHTVRDIRPA